MKRVLSESPYPSNCDLLNNSIVLMYSIAPQCSMIDPGDQILLKIQSAQNRFKSNRCIGLIVTNPTQFERVQTDIG
jgi:hypothetical protein